MPGLREGITKTFRRLSRRSDSRPSSASLAETVVATDMREGRLLAGYRILRPIGFGGMGQVYLAIDTRLGRHAALKFLSPSLSSGPEMLQRLQQEARAASSLNHPNILTIYDIGDAGGEHFIASEFVEGSTLRTALERQLIDLPAAIEIATQVASALAAAHAAGVIHRDLKPSNIMIRPDGLVKVIDFGLAKIASENPTEPSLHGASRSGAIAGTVEYMSPEQARGDDIDARSDIWSLGVVLYEMVSRKLPFDGETESHVIVGILDHPVPPLPQSGSLPRGIVGVLDRALAKDRNKRYQSARDMLLELKSIAPALDRATALKRFASLPDGPAARAIPRIAALVTLLALVAIWWWPFHGEEALLGPRWFIPGPAEQITFDGKIGVGAMSPDGTYLAFTSRGGERETLHIRNLLTQSELQLPPFEDSALGLTFSPDSRSLYYVLKDRREWGRLFSAGVTSSIPRPVLDDIDGPISFSPDGSEFAFMRRSDDKRTSTESIIVAQTADTGDQRVLVRKSNTQIGRSIAWSPAGNRIAVVLYNLGLNRSVHPTLVLFSPDGKPRESFSNPKLRTINGPVWLANGSVIAFAGVAQNAANDQARLYEFSVNTGALRTGPSPNLLFDSMSAARNGKLLQAVRSVRTSALWVAAATDLDSPSRQPTGEDSFESLAWENDDSLIFPSARSTSVNLWMLDAEAHSRLLAAAEDCVEQQPFAVPASPLVVYSSNCAGGGDFNIWEVNRESGARVQLTSGSNHDYRPQAAPDGKWIVYESWVANIPSLWKIPVSGGAPLPLTHLQARAPSISPDGASIVCQIRENYDGLWRAAILSFQNGSIKRELPALPTASSSAPLMPVRWSPDGAAIDFASSQGGASNIWRLSLETSQLRQLTHLSSEEVYDFAWNRNGIKLAYISGHAERDVVLFHRVAR